MLKAARNLGTPNAYLEEIFTRPVCKISETEGIPFNGYDPAPQGCGGLNYCECALKAFPVNEAAKDLFPDPQEPQARKEQGEI